MKSKPSERTKNVAKLKKPERALKTPAKLKTPTPSKAPDISKVPADWGLVTRKIQAASPEHADLVRNLKELGGFWDLDEAPPSNPLEVRAVNPFIR